jgi:peptidyl-prolyl cis-trans isomerase D
VRFRSADFANDVQVSDADIAKYFESHKAQLKTDEKRRVKFVSLSLTDEQKKLTGKQRIEALQKLADKANEFTEALQAKDAEFDQVAAKLQLALKETSDFSQATPDPQLAGAPQLAQTAFALTKESPNSDAIQTPEGFYIEHLTNIEPSRPLNLEEARPKIVDSLKKERAQQTVALQATAAGEKIREVLKSGKPVEEAAAQAGVKAEKIPAFSLLDNPPGATPAAKPEPKNESPEMQYIKQAASEMNPGDLSQFVPTPEGGLLVVLEKREPLNVAQFNAARPFVESRALQNKSQVVFFEWLRERRRAAGVEETKRQAAPG